MLYKSTYIMLLLSIDISKIRWRFIIILTWYLNMISTMNIYKQKRLF